MGEYFEEFVEEHDFLGGVGEWPVAEESLDEEGGERGVFGEEEHGAPEELLVVELAGLDLVERDDDGLEEDHVLLPERHGEPADDAGQDVEQLGGSVELVVLVDQAVEAVVDGLRISSALSTFRIIFLLGTSFA